MQRSEWLLPASATFSTALAYAFLDWPAALVVAGGWCAGVLLGRLAAGPAPKRAQGKSRASPAPPRRAAVVQARGAQLPVMEAAAARLDPHAQGLRLTGDILRGMQTGGKTTRGRCSRCSSTIWLSAHRPVRARCPVCGFSRVLTR